MFKYGGKSKSINIDVFHNRKDHQRFVYWSGKMNDEEHAIKFCVFNFIKDRDWFYSGYEDAQNRYLNGMRVFSTLTDDVKNGIDTIRRIKEDKNISQREMFEHTKSGNRPPILQLYLQDIITLELVCLLNKRWNFADIWKDSLDPFIRNEAQKIVKYTPFVLKYSSTKLNG